MKKVAILILILCVFKPFGSPLIAKERDYFRLYGDIFSMLPLMAGMYSLTQEDYRGLGYLALSSGSVMAITFASKYYFVSLANTNPSLARISRRPDKREYDGFPSGHTASAFAAAGFMQKRYGYKLGIPTTILATLVGISRVTSNRHTWIQVLAGASLGYLMSYFITDKEDDMSLLIDFDTTQSRISPRTHRIQSCKIQFGFVF